MFKLLSITALASAIVLATAASVTPSQAFGHSGPHVGGAGHGHYSFAHGPAGHKFIGKPIHMGHLHHHHWYRWHRWHHGYGWTIPVAVGVAGVAAYQAAPAAPVCTCLTKQYLDNGSVLFTDTCTNETALAMPPAGTLK
jgi:hypothetical protein